MAYNTILSSLVWRSAKNDYRRADEDPSTSLRAGSPYVRSGGDRDDLYVRFFTWYDYETRFGAVKKLTDHIKAAVHLLMADEGRSDELIDEVKAQINEKLAIYHDHLKAEKEKKR